MTPRKRINWFYVAMITMGITLFMVLSPGVHTDLSFYGFAESNETEINYNHPVVVDRILVTPGQAVKAGDILMHLSRRKSKETLEDQSFRIGELKAEEAVWQQRKENELAQLQLDKQIKLSEINAEIQQAEKELDFKRSLSENLKSIRSAPSNYKPLEEELKALRAEKRHIIRAFDLKIKGLRKEIKMGNSPYKEQIKRLTAEQDFEVSQRVQQIIVTAPADGLVGNILCKEEEHIPSYRTLLSFYEPHSSIIKGYVHEDLTLKVNIGDNFKVASLKDPDINYSGRVIGLGSRIVEIPTRLRKIPDVKSYGREVLVEITKRNGFLQKEKVSLSCTASGKINY